MSHQICNTESLWTCSLPVPVAAFIDVFNAYPMLESLNLPTVEPVSYPRNFIQRAVCELRFPTLYGLERSKPPVKLANALRKNFPQHSTADNINVGVGGIAQEFAYIFADKRNKATVTVRPSAISLEVTAYKSFDSFRERLTMAVVAAKDVIDTDFFTRIGLRYINEIPIPEGEVAGWVNPMLVQPLEHNFFSSLSEYNCRIAGAVEGEGFLFRHGVNIKEDGGVTYLLDFDLWREDVQVEDLPNVIEILHTAGLKIFHWAAGEKTISSMKQQNT